MFCSQATTEAWAGFLCQSESCLGPELQQGERGEKGTRRQSWEALGKLHCVSMNTCVMKISGSAVAELTFVPFSGESCWNSLQRRLLGTTVTSVVWLKLVARTLPHPLFFLVPSHLNSFSWSVFAEVKPKEVAHSTLCFPARGTLSSQEFPLGAE